MSVEEYIVMSQLRQELTELGVEKVDNLHQQVAIFSLLRQMPKP